MTSAAGDLPAPRSRARRIGGLVAGLLVVGFLGAAVIDGWGRLTSYDWNPDPWLLLVSVVAIAGALAAAALAYVILLEQLTGRRLPRMHLVAIWGRSLLGRYVPGNVVMVAGRVVLGREAGISGRVSLAASVYEQGLALGVSAVAAIGFLLSAGDIGQGPWLWLVAAVPLGLLLLHPRVFKPLSSAILRKVGREPLEVFLSPRQVIAFGGVYAVVYALLALGVWASVVGIAGHGAGNPLYVGAAFLLSFVISMVAFVFPSGLGVREGIFALALGSHLPGSVAIAVAAGARVVMTAVEVGFAAITVALARHRSKRHG